MQSQGIIHLDELDVAFSGAHVSTKGSYVYPSRQDPDIDAFDRHGLYVDENPPRLVSFMMKVGVEEIRDANALTSIPTKKVQLVGHVLNTFIAWPKHLVKPFSEMVFPFCCVYYY